MIRFFIRNVNYDSVALTGHGFISFLIFFPGRQRKIIPLKLQGGK